MTTPFVGEIQVFGFNFVPNGWAACNGAVLPIAQNTALFSLIGVSYGGNGTTTFQLPNFTNRAPCSQGTGPGLTPRTIGETFGDNSVTLDQTTMPSHSHSLTIFRQTDSSKRSAAPGTGYGITPPDHSTPFVSAAPTTTFAPNTIAPAGGSIPHENRQPFLALNYCIALQGVYPSFD